MQTIGVISEIRGSVFLDPGNDAKDSEFLSYHGRMNESQGQATLTSQLLSQAVAGDTAAVDALLRHNCDRLTALTRRMLGDFQRVRRWAETGDVLQNAMLRLLSALRDVKPATP